MSKFAGIAKHSAFKELRQKIWDMCGAILLLPCVKGISQHEELFRKFREVIDKGEITGLPYFSDGIGSKQNRLVSCVAAEMSCLLVAFWEFNKNATGPTAECVNDHIVYLENILADPSTLRVEELPKCCRFRVVNSRIDAGERLNEGAE